MEKVLLIEQLWGSLELYLAQILVSAEKLILLGLFFTGLGLILKQSMFVNHARNTAREVRLNLTYYAISIAVLSPLLTMVTTGVVFSVYNLGLDLLHPPDYGGVHAAWVLLATVAVSDFVGYWRHRLMHTAWLWPVHAIHHSDTAMTWISLSRSHPLNKLITTSTDIAVLVMLGFPPWAIVMNAVIRNLYGYWEHADTPWTYGPLGYLFVSPVLHRWHHVRDGQGVNSNFATIFGLFDFAFGTYHLPGAKVSRLGIPEPDFPRNWVGQTLYPFKMWLGPVLKPDLAKPAL